MDLVRLVALRAPGLPARLPARAQLLERAELLARALRRERGRAHAQQPRRERQLAAK